ncbi:hypothetical protein DBO93_00710 [Colwellia sp. Arc7-D]|nr:hypothetical protein DBO93_00710 [Colwellia sp. Arc7-D]
MQVEVKSESVVQNNTQKVSQQYPNWVLDGFDNINTPIGIACTKIKSNSYQANLDAKAYALEVARLDLFKQLKNEQYIDAQETFHEYRMKKHLKVTIKRVSKGNLPRNKIIHESVVRIDGRKEICLAVSLLA